MNSNIKYTWDLFDQDIKSIIDQIHFSEWIPDYSPLYCLHYKILGVLFPDGIELYYANYRFWDLILGISVYALQLSTAHNTKGHSDPDLHAQSNNAT